MWLCKVIVMVTVESITGALYYSWLGGVLTLQVESLHFSYNIQMCMGVLAHALAESALFKEPQQ